MSRGKNNGLRVGPKRILSPLEAREKRLELAQKRYQTYFAAYLDRQTYQNNEQKAITQEALRYHTLEQAWKETKDVDFMVKLPFLHQSRLSFEDRQQKLLLIAIKEIRKLKEFQYLPVSINANNDFALLELFKDVTTFKLDDPLSISPQLKRWRIAHLKDLQMLANDLRDNRGRQYAEAEFKDIEGQIALVEAMISLIDAGSGQFKMFNFNEVHYYLNKFHQRQAHLKARGKTYEQRITDSLREKFGYNLFGDDI